MGRCSCGGGATCSCVVQGEGNIRVEGAGTSASPYVITSTGDYSANFTVQDTDTVDLSLTGDGSVNEPFQLRADVTAQIQDLSNFNDPEGGPQSGEVPVWIVDHWEFQPPPSVIPGSVTTGSGLTGDGSGINPLMLAVSGIWGEGSMLNFPADSLLGYPIYIDSASQARARPLPVVRHAQSAFTPVAGWTLMPTGNFWCQWGSMVYISGYIRRTGATIASNSNGNIADVVIGNLLSTVPKPLANTALPPWGGSLFTAALTPAGVGVLGGLPPNVALAGGAAGHTIAFSCEYIANVQPVI